ncbi:MAG: hypothetical protein V3U54_07345 [Thermodesulfobacteriota bacterium]
MWKCFRYIGIVLAVIGAIAAPENLNKWLKTLGINMDISTITDQNTIRWIIVGIGIFMVIISLDVCKKIRDKKTFLQIGFDIEKFPDCFVDTSEAYEDPQTNKTVRLSFSEKWRIFIYNPSSKKTVKNVEVKLIDVNKCLLGDARNLPEVHLKFAHDNNREQRSVSINPLSRQFVDVIECYMKSGRSNENIFWVQHIEKNESLADLKLFYNNIDKEDCEIRIEVTGENATCKPKNFIVSLIGNKIKMRPT